MDEFLKTIRFLHQVLIGVCAALIAFSLSPDPKAGYTTALLELNVILRQLTLHDYAMYAKTVAQHDDEEEAAYLKQRFDRNKLIVENYALPISQKFTVTRPYYCEYPKDNATVADYLQFVDSGGLIGEVGFEYGEIPGVPELLAKILKEQRRVKSKLTDLKPELREVFFKLSEEIPQEKFPWQDLSGESHEASDDEFEFPHNSTRLLNVPRIGLMGMNVSPPDKREFRGEIGLTFTSNVSSLVSIEPSLSSVMPGVEDGRVVTTIYVNPSASYFYGKKHLAVDWLRTMPDLFRLVHRARDGQDILFPNLKPLMNQLQTMSLTDASKFLQDKIDSTHNDLSFLGISIQQEVAVWVGPLVVALIMVYLLSHFRHLHNIDNLNGPPMKMFPWIGIFEDSLSRTLTFISIAIMPVASETALLVRSGHWSNRTTLAGVLLGIATGVVAVLLLAEIGLVRKQFNRLSA